MVELDSRGKIEEFLQSLISLREALNAGNIIYTAFVSARISSKVESLCKYELYSIGRLC